MFTELCSCSMFDVVCSTCERDVSCLLNASLWSPLRATGHNPHMHGGVCSFAQCWHHHIKMLHAVRFTYCKSALPARRIDTVAYPLVVHALIVVLVVFVTVPHSLCCWAAGNWLVAVAVPILTGIWTCYSRNMGMKNSRNPVHVGNLFLLFSSADCNSVKSLYLFLMTLWICCCFRVIVIAIKLCDEYWLCTWFANYRIMAKL